MTKRGLVLAGIVMCSFLYVGSHASSNSVSAVAATPKPRASMNAVTRRQLDRLETQDCADGDTDFKSDPYGLPNSDAPSSGTLVRITYRGYGGGVRGRFLVHAGGHYFTTVTSANGEVQTIWAKYPGGDFEYEFQQCIGGQFYAYTQTDRDVPTGPYHLYRFNSDNSQANIEWPVEPPQVSEPMIVLHVDGPQKCGGIPGIFRVATNYAYAYTTGPNRSNQRPVKSLSVRIKYDSSFSQEPSNSGGNIGFVEASEQIRNVGPTIDACTGYRVYGEAVTESGRHITVDVHSHRV